MNQRVFPRARPRLDEPVKVQIMGNGFLEERHARDISEGGLGLLVPHHFADCDINGIVNIVIKFGGQRPFMAKGVIRHKAKDGAYYGVEFTEISEDARAYIRAYVKLRIADGGIA